MSERSPESIKRTQELRRQAKKGRSVKDGTFKPATPLRDRKRYKKGGDVEKDKMTNSQKAYAEGLRTGKGLPILRNIDKGISKADFFSTPKEKRMIEKGYKDMRKAKKAEKARKKDKKMKDGGEVKRHHSYAGGYEHGIKVEKNIKNKVIKKVEDTVAHRLSNKIPGQKNKKFSAGYNQGKADYKKAKDAEKVKKLNKGGTVIVDRNYLKGR
tara:strand:+ start:338 stop:973 length:636 start_codon:yes stop_codon:yes gene_type:complete